MNAVHDRERGVDACQFFDDDGLGDIVDGGAPVGFGDGDAVKAVFQESGPLFGGGNLVLIAMLNRGCKHRFSKVPHQLANHLLFVGFAEVHALTIRPTLWSFLIRLIPW